MAGLLNSLGVGPLGLPEIVGIAAGLILAVLWWRSRPRRILRRGGYGHALDDERGASDEVRLRFAHQRSWLHLHDALVRRSTRRKIVATMVAEAVVRDRLGRAGHAKSVVDGYGLDTYGDRRSGTSGHDHVISPITAWWAGRALLLGDVFVASAVVMANERSLTPVQAYGTVAALSVTLWLLGKVLGAALATFRDLRPGSAALLLGLTTTAVLVGTGASFMAIRHGNEVGWFLLTMLPAFGSAAVRLVEGDDQHRAATGNAWAQRADRLRLQHALRRLGRAEQRWARRCGRAVTVLHRDVVALQHSEIARYLDDAPSTIDHEPPAMLGLRGTISLWTEDDADRPISEIVSSFRRQLGRTTGSGVGAHRSDWRVASATLADEHGGAGGSEGGPANGSVANRTDVQPRIFLP